MIGRVTIKLDNMSYVSADIESRLIQLAVRWNTPWNIAQAALLALRHMRGDSTVFFHSDYFSSETLRYSPWDYAAQCFAIAEHLIAEKGSVEE